MNVAVAQLAYTPGVWYDELDGSPTLRIGGGQTEATRTLRIRTVDLINFATAMLPRLTPSGNQLVLRLGPRMPLFPTINLIPDSMTIKPWSASRTANPYAPPQWQHDVTYDYLEADINYRIAPAVRLLMVVEERMDPAVEFLTLPSRRLYWDNAQKEPLTEEEAPGALQYSAEWKYKVKGLPAPLPGTFTLIGQTNTVAMWSPRYKMTFPIGTVLYQAPETEEYMSVWGDQCFDVTYHFMYRGGGWNKIPKGGTATPSVVYDAAGNPFNPYTPSDLNVLTLAEVAYS